MSPGSPGLPPPRPIPIKDRSSILFIARGQLDVIDGAFVVVDALGVRTVIPVGGIACLMLEPGTRVSHAAVVLAARAGTLLISDISARGDPTITRPSVGSAANELAVALPQPGQVSVWRRYSVTLGRTEGTSVT